MWPFAFSSPCHPDAALRPKGAAVLRARGYTAVEVLMAMTVMAIGAAAVMSMQKASVQGTSDARNADIANSIARTWVERLQRDSMQWTQPGPSNPGGNNLASAAILSFGSAGGTLGKWFLPTQYIAVGNAPPISPGFDILGRDLAQADLPSAFFCVNVRLTWLAQPVPPPFSQSGLLRADVRVLWPRGISAAPPAGGVCDAAVATSDAPDPLVFHAIYVTTGIRGNPQ